MKTTAKIEFGDYQTPVELAKEICGLLARCGVKADAVIEPTCGTGAFLLAAATIYPRAELFGWDINPAYVEEAKSSLERAGLALRSTLTSQDYFTCDWSKAFSAIPGHLLILGNLPWVTNAVVSALRGENVPKKENFLGLRGLAARTGKANFDISEWMLIQLIKVLRGRVATIAILCKTAIARKALRYGWQNDGQISAASFYRIDAKHHFGVAVDACLLLVQTGQTGPSEAAVFNDFVEEKPASVFGLAGQDLVANIRAYHRLKRFEGLCPYQWRSGVKHDCASVMEFVQVSPDGFENKLGEQMQLESDYLFPLLKCTDLAHGRTNTERWILVPQTHVGQNTREISGIAPKTWAYLKSHEGLFAARKSSIYNNGKIPFAVFGVGEYTFAPWKVAISAMHKASRFVLLNQQQDKPTLLDDTCYFLSFDNQHEAEIVCALLNSEPCRQFLHALIFPDSKRPVTVDVLQRLNLHALAVETGVEKDWVRARKTHYTTSKTNSRQPELVMED